MKKTLKITALVLTVIIVGFFALKLIRSLTVQKELGQIQTEHFIIFYSGIYESEAKKVSLELEANYNRIRSELKDPEHNTIKVHIHPNQQEFNKATGLINSTANGTSRGPLEFHFIWTNWFNSIFPHNPLQTAVHEFTHCVQLNILISEATNTLAYDNSESFDIAFEKKFSANYPQWLWESICTYEAKERNIFSIKYGMKLNPTLEELNTGNQVYNVGYTIIEYIVHEWGIDLLPELIRSYCDFENVLGVSENEFEEGWYKFVDENY